MVMMALWLEKKKAPDLFKALTLLLGGSTEYSRPEPPGDDRPDEKPDVIGLIPWFSLRDGAFTTDLCALWKKGCRRFVLVTPSSEHPLPWAGFPAHLRTAFDVAIQVCDTPSLERLQQALGAAKSVEPWANSRVQEYVEARTLYADLLSIFSHNSQSDLSNQFLAPARLLCLANDKKIHDEWNTVWNGGPNGFQQIVLNNLQGKYGFLGKELTRAAAPITEGLTKLGGLSEADLESLMALLTGIRVSAGVRTHAGNSSGSNSKAKVEPVCAEGAVTGFRVLVVDDHAASWRPVFEKLRDKLAAGEPTLDVCFEFSVDGKIAHLCDGRTQEPIHFSYYDLVILDVFLGGTTGVKILNLLRRDFSQLPVLLWTTSRDEEITAEVTLANGVLLKKTVTWRSLTEAVTRWVESGKAMRTRSLPNPFFNHTIRNLEYRKLAVEFHEWCLKQLDSFHALDGEYFRYFTDHGGRHIVKLWELLEQALQPFLQDDKETLLPKEAKQRELEILGLYLTVICHELGMFPMRIGSGVENFATLGKGYLNDVRSLHAVRGMVLLHDCSERKDKYGVGQYWNDKRGGKLGAELRATAPGVAEHLAVLVGYHARVFKSMSDNAFLKWVVSKEDRTGAKYDLATKLDRLSSPIPSLSRTDSAIRMAFRKLSTHFACDKLRRDRLRRQSALFRFVDALDITASRNPAEFLVGSGSLPPKQYGENLKREVCKSAEIRNGEVCVEIIPPPPQVEIVKQIINYVSNLNKEETGSVKRALEFLEMQSAATRVERPWALDFNSLSLLQSESALVLQKPLDCWLTNVWEVIMGDGGKGEFVRELRKIKVLHATAVEPTLTLAGAQIIASITALSVAGELLDEYQAIVEAGLSDKIRLAPFGWDGNEKEAVWSKLPDGLTTLEKALPAAETV